MPSTIASGVLPPRPREQACELVQQNAFNALIQKTQRERALIQNQIDSLRKTQQQPLTNPTTTTTTITSTSSNSSHRRHVTSSNLLGSVVVNNESKAEQSWPPPQVLSHLQQLFSQTFHSPRDARFRLVSLKSKAFSLELLQANILHKFGLDLTLDQLQAVFGDLMDPGGKIDIQVRAS